MTGDARGHSKGGNLSEHRADGQTRTPAEWERLECVVVLDPDGWRYDSKEWGDPIQFAEWERRMAASTILLVARHNASQPPHHNNP